MEIRASLIYFPVYMELMENLWKDHEDFVKGVLSGRIDGRHESRMEVYDSVVGGRDL